MKLKRFDQHLRTLTSKVYENKAPAGETEYILWHRYGSQTQIGDDSVAVALPRVQLDILWQDPDSLLCDQLKELLCALRLPWEEIDCGYDDEWASMRCILQLTVD